MMNIEQLGKLYASKHFRRQEKKQALQIHSRVRQQNWNISGKPTPSQQKLSRNFEPYLATTMRQNTESDILNEKSRKSSNLQLKMNQQMAKSYGNGGFFR